MSDKRTDRTTRERVIVGVDPERPSTVAVDWVVRRARTRRVQVTLVTAFDTLIDDPMLARERLVQLAARITSVHPGVRVDIELANASIHRTMADLSERADLVVIGSHRDRPIRSLLSGSLPARIAAHSHCPAVVVPHDWEPREGAIVVGVGDDLTAETALMFAATEAEKGGRMLEIVHAWRIPSISSLAVASLVASDDQESVRAAHRELLTAATSRVRDEFPRVRISERLEELSTGPALTAGGTGTELIVIGTHHHGVEFGLLVGSTASRLLRYSRVPICVVPATDRHQQARARFDVEGVIATVEA